MYLAKTIYGEARGENQESRIAVAYVIKNRHIWWDKSYKEVVTQPYQFSCWLENDPNYDDIMNPQGNAWTDCLKIAKDVYNGTTPYPFGKDIITNYYSPCSMPKGQLRPDWSDPKREFTLPNVDSYVFVKP